MAYTKRTWLGRQGTGLNKFSIGGASPVTIVNQPDSVTQVGDALSAGNLNDLEDRIEDAFDDVDTELATKADEQDVTNLNNAINQLDHRLENIEQSKGDYIVSAYKDGSVTPSGKGKWCVVEGVEGVSRVENNIITNGNFESASGWSFALGGTGGSYSVADNIVKIIFGNNNSIFQIYRSGSYLGFSYTSGHSYLVFVKVRLSVNASVRVVQYETNNIHNGSNITVKANQWTLIPLLFTAGASGQFETNVQSIGGMSQGDVIEAKEFVVTDLSVYFGGTIPSDADTIAKIQTNYPHLLLPSDYGTRIVDWTGNGVRAVGVNIWDEEWKLGNYSDSTGEYVNAGNYVISKNPIPILPNYTYYCNTLLRKFYYDADMNYIGNTANLDSAFTTPANAFYMNIRVHQETGAYNHDVQVCDNALSSEVKNTYHPYQSNTLSFPSISLKSAGSVRDTLELNVEVDGVERRRQTTRVGSITVSGSSVGLQTDAYTNIDYYFANKPSNYKYNNTSSADGLMIQNYPKILNYPVGGAYDTTANVGVAFTGFIYARLVFGFAKGTTLEQAQSALNGLTINYELAEESVTLSDPIIDNTLLTESGGRLSTVQTGTVVDGISDLGFITL